MSIALATVVDSVIKFIGLILIDTVTGAWVTGLPEEANIVVAGQGFVKRGSKFCFTIDYGNCFNSCRQI